MTDACIVAAYERAVEDVRVATERRDSLRVAVEAVIRRSEGEWHTGRRYTIQNGGFCTATSSGPKRVAMAGWHDGKPETFEARLERHDKTLHFGSSKLSCAKRTRLMHRLFAEDNKADAEGRGTGGRADA